MRDPKRIHEVCEALETAWQQHPDMRLGQFLEMVFPHSEHGITLIFGQEDDVTMRKLKEVTECI